MNDTTITIGIIIALAGGVYFFTKNNKNVTPKLTANQKTDIKAKINYTRDAMYTAYNAQDVDEYLRLQRELQFLELEDV